MEGEKITQSGTEALMMAATWGNRPIYNRDTDATSNYL